jgi:hypothetical protein
MSRLLAPLSILLAAPLLAQTPTPPPAASNPYVHDETRTDAETKAAAQFAAMDINHDGFVTVEEITAFIAARRPSTRSGTLPAPSALAKDMIDDADSDHDGKVSPAEAKAAADRGFDSVDTNKDGVISPAERVAANQEVLATRRARPQETGR